MNVIKTELEGLLILEPVVFKDNRGYFFEMYAARDFEKIVPGVHFVQDNESGSAKGVLRGLHFQKGRYSQAKLVRVPVGKVLDVAVDLRLSSPTFGRYHAEILSGDNKRMFFIPKGFAHGYLVMEDHTVFQYKCDEFYEPSSAGSLLWCDPSIGIDWKMPAGEIILSDKDRNAPLLCEIKKELENDPFSL